MKFYKKKGLKPYQVLAISNIIYGVKSPRKIILNDCWLLLRILFAIIPKNLSISYINKK